MPSHINDHLPEGQGLAKALVGLHQKIDALHDKIDALLLAQQPADPPPPTPPQSPAVQ